MSMDSKIEEDNLIQKLVAHANLPEFPENLSVRAMWTADGVPADLRIPEIWTEEDTKRGLPYIRREIALLEQELGLYSNKAERRAERIRRLERTLRDLTPGNCRTILEAKLRKTRDRHSSLQTKWTRISKKSKPSSDLSRKAHAQQERLSILLDIEREQDPESQCELLRAYLKTSLQRKLANAHHRESRARIRMLRHDVLLRREHWLEGNPKPRKLEDYALLYWHRQIPEFRKNIGKKRYVNS